MSPANMHSQQEGVKEQEDSTKSEPQDNATERSLQGFSYGLYYWQGLRVHFLSQLFSPLQTEHMPLGSPVIISNFYL